MSSHTLLVASFVLLIAVGTLGLLVLPGLTVGPRLGFVDALFTITSATCVTGLVVVDTATVFTFWGQVWILLFIQLGGLGLITLSTAVIGMLGRRLSLRSAVVVATVRATHGRELAALAWGVARYVFLIEAVGAAVLWLLLSPRYGVVRGLWHAAFHAISAVCNAGFSTLPNNLVDEAEDPAVLITVSFLVILGGIGYLTLVELSRWRRAGAFRAPTRLSAHSFSVVVVTAVLLVAGAVLFLVFEWNGALRSFGLVDKLVNAWFMSVTPRTAGFNAVRYTDVTNAGAFLTVLLMMIGGCPGSTAGGIKTTTFAVLVMLALSRMRGRHYVEISHRAVPEGTVQRAVSLFVVSFALVTVATFFLSVSEAVARTFGEARAAFLPMLFESVSAFGTVGLSMDLTPTLSVPGRLAITALMFVGRVGPITFFAAIALRAAGPSEVRPAHEDLIIG